MRAIRTFRYFIAVSLCCISVAGYGGEVELGVDVDDDFERFLEEYKNRKRYSSLDTETLAQISDELLEQAIIDYIFLKLESNWEDEREIISSLSPGLRGLYATWWMSAEVSNGGFNQYFWNSSGYWAADAIRAFGDYGATELQSIAKEAVAMFLREAETHRKFRNIGTLEAFSESYGHTDLGSLDERFWNADDSLSAMRIRYIREHPEEFTGE